MEELSQGIISSIGAEAALQSWTNERLTADKLYEVMDRMGVPMRAVYAFYHLEELGNPGDIKLTADEKERLVRAYSAKTEGDEESQSTRYPHHERFLRQWVRGCLELDRILDDHTKSEKREDIDKASSQRIALILAFRYMQDFYSKFYSIQLPTELSVRTAHMSREAERLRTLFIDHQFEPMDNISDRVVLMRGVTHMNEEVGEYNYTAAPTVQAALAMCNIDISNRERDGEHLTEKQKVGMMIRAARLALNYTQGTLARNEDTGEMDFSVSYVSAVERGQIMPSVKSLARLAHKFRVSTRDLMPEE